MEHGHSEAGDYPLGLVWVEASIVVDRVNRFHATQAALTQLAVASILSKDAQKELKEQIERLSGTSVKPETKKKTGKDLLARLRRNG